VISLKSVMAVAINAALRPSNLSNAAAGIKLPFEHTKDEVFGVEWEFPLSEFKSPAMDCWTDNQTKSHGGVEMGSWEPCTTPTALPRTIWSTNSEMRALKCPIWND
jgi:hypothetical protein